MATKALKLKVLGRVQRVGYRGYLLDLAVEEGVSGYAKNERDGSVTVLAQGDETGLARFASGVKSPPPPAAVKRVQEISVRPLAKLKHFEIKFGRVAEELQEGFGAMQAEFRDYREEFRDYRQEFRDYREEFRGFGGRTDTNFKELAQKYGEISEKLTKIMDALLEESKKSKEMLEAIREESKHGRETLAESLRLLREAVERLPRQQ